MFDIKSKVVQNRLMVVRVFAYLLMVVTILPNFRCDSGDEEPTEMDLLSWVISSSVSTGSRWEGHADLIECQYQPDPPNSITNCLALEMLQDNMDPLYPVNLVLSLTEINYEVTGTAELTVPHFNYTPIFFSVDVSGTNSPSQQDVSSLLSLSMSGPPENVDGHELNIISLSGDVVNDQITGNVIVELRKSMEVDRATLKYSFMLEKVL